MTNLSSNVSQLKELVSVMSSLTRSDDIIILSTSEANVHVNVIANYWPIINLSGYSTDNVLGVQNHIVDENNNMG